ncbi:MAG: hypothetical protein CVU88_00590 [Firmicutes bacterium HGW-Firmicutes-13]|nr:MAG: hypothetical protein CVU88_00590 [Firmicutes bacterium HGW-Firmicutes-13]
METRELKKIKKELAQLRREHQHIAVRINRLEKELLKIPAIQPLDDSTSAVPDISKTEKLAEQFTEQLAEQLTTGPKEKLTPTREEPRPEGEIHGPEIEPARSDKEKNLEFRIGGTWLNRIGVVAVILGLTFFLKYAFDNNWIGPTGRVLLGVFAGLIMLVAGEKLRERYSSYAQGLLGGGSLALYVSVYAGFEFYKLISPLFAFVFLAVVMANTVFMSVRHSSLPIGILGIIGGYAIPVLIGSTEPSLWSLIIYLTLLTTGVLGVSIYKRWRRLQYLSFTFNQLYLAYVMMEYCWWGVSHRHLVPLFTHLISIFILYLGVAAVYNLRSRIKAGGLDIALNTLNAFLFLAWSIVLLNKTFLNNYLGFYALLLALVYIFLGKTAYRLFSEDKAQTYCLYLISFVFITVAVPLQFTGVYIGLAWLAESVGLVFTARRIQNHKMALAGLAVLALGLFSTYRHLGMLWSYSRFLLNVPTLLLLSSLAALLLIIRFVEDMDGLPLFDYKAGNVLKVFFLFQVFYGLTVQNSHYFRLFHREFFLSPEQLSLSALWLIYAVVLFTAGIRKKNRYLRYAALGLLAVIILKAFFVDLAYLDAMFKILLFIFLGVSLLGISYIYQKKKDALQGEEEKM